MPVITISCLGTKGRMGNNCFQWAFAKGYAAWAGAELQTPDWWGRKVFPVAAADPLIDRQFQKTHCDSVCQQMGHALGYFFGKIDIDLDGYFQHQCFLDYYNRQQCREWFRIDPALNLYSPACTATDPYTAMHLRRGDYLKPPFNKLYATVSDESYGKAIEQFNIPSPIIPVYEGAVAPPKQLVDLCVPWLWDWLVLRDAEHLLRANSSFSWWAGTCGTGKVYSPVVENKVGKQHVPFALGNWPTLAGGFANQSDLRLKEE